MVELLFIGSRAPLFICGGSFTPWLILDVSTSSRLPRRIADVWLLGDDSKVASMAQEDRDLDTFLAYVDGCQATDPRDYLFAIAGFLPETMQIMQLPDYALSLSVVYQRMTLALIRADKGRYRTCVRGSRHNHILSWCLDFSASDWHTSFANYREGGTMLDEHMPGWSDMCRRQIVH